MPAHYSIIQFTPNPSTGERINVGVIVWEGNKIRSRFTTDYRRLKSFAPVSVDLVRSFSKKFDKLTQDQLDLVSDERITTDRLKSMIGAWDQMLQFTSPKGSLKGAEVLLNEMVYLFMPERTPEHHEQRRLRKGAIKVAVNQMSLALGDGAKAFLKRDKEIAGGIETHKVDVALENGKIVAAINALSFEAEDQASLEHEIGATAWTFRDIAKHRSITRAIFYLEPEDKKLPAFRHAKALFPKLGVELVAEPKIQAWTKRHAAQLSHAS